MLLNNFKKQPDVLHLARDSKIKIINILALIDLVLTDRLKEINKIMLRIVIHNLIFIVKYDKKIGIQIYVEKNGSVFAGVMKFLRKEITAIRY